MHPAIAFKASSGRDSAILYDNCPHSRIGIHVVLVNNRASPIASLMYILLLAFQHISKPNYLFSNRRQATIHIPNESDYHSNRFHQHSRRFMVALATELVPHPINDTQPRNYRFAIETPICSPEALFPQALRKASWKQFCAGTRVPDHKGLNPWPSMSSTGPTRISFTRSCRNFTKETRLAGKTNSKEAKTAPLLLIVSSKIESDKAPRANRSFPELPFARTL